MIVLDATVLIAYLDGSDEHHSKATRLLVEHAGEAFAANTLTVAETLVRPARDGRVADATAAFAALGITVSWGAYAFFKRALPIGPNQGFLLEVLILTPFALALIAYVTARGESHFLAGVPEDTWLLMGTGLVTAVPLILYGYGAKGLKLSTIGILQYIAPTMIFLTAVFVFGEPMGTARMIAFPMIWAALAIYTGTLLAKLRVSRPAG